MRFRFLAALAAVFAMAGGAADARAESACLGLDMADPAAVEACARTEPKVAGKFPHWLRVADPCYESQRVIARLALQAGAAAQGRRLKGGEEDGAPRPSCATVAATIERLRGEPPEWLACDGYDGSEAHLRACFAGMAESQAQRRHFQPAALARLDCAGIRQRYEFALGRVYDFHFGEDGAGRRLPPGYAPPDCALAEAVAAEAQGGAATARKQARDQARAQRSAALRARQDRERQARERSRRAAEQRQAAAQAERDRMAALDRAALASSRAAPQPADRVEAAFVRAALVDALHRIYPEGTAASEIGEARLRHTAGGLRAEAGSSAVLRGVAQPDGLSCSKPDRAGAVRCRATVRMVEQALTPPITALGLLTGQVAPQLVFSNRAKDLSLRLEHRDGRWRAVDGGALRVFLEGHGSHPGRFWQAWLPKAEWPHGRPEPGDGRARSAYIDSAARPAMSMFFSLGCSHCLTDMTPKFLGALEGAAKLGLLDIELVEVSGLIARRDRDAEADAAAARMAATAGWIYDCATTSGAATPLGGLVTFVETMQARTYEKEAYRNWVYDPAAGEALRAYAAAIERTPAYAECLSNDRRQEALARIDARRDRAREEHPVPIPVFVYEGRRVDVEELLNRLVGLMEDDRARR